MYVIVVLWLAALVVIFGGYEVIERLWLKQEGMPFLHTLHLTRGIFASAVTALLIGTYLIKKRPVTTILGTPLSYLPLPESETLRQRTIWFIHMRWLTIALTAIAVLFTTQLSDILPKENFAPLIACLMVLIGGNLAFHYYSASARKPYRLIIGQVVFDLAILTLLLHFSGGIENPFFLAYIFHIVIAGIVLSRRDAFWITVLAALLFSGLVTAELFGAIPHSYIGLFPHGPHGEIHAAHDVSFVVGRALPFLFVLGFVAYFTTLLKEQIRRDEMSVSQAGKLASLGEFSGRIAHEVNNPISIISAKTKLLLENKDLPEKVGAELEKIDHHCNRISELTQGLLALCRPSFGKKEPLDLTRVIDTTIPLLEVSQMGANIKLNKRLSPNLPPINGNRNEIQQIILNLANNAIDVMREGGTLTIETGMDKEGSVLLGISDTGPGIPKEIMRYIFDPFFTTKEEGKGTGLGLSITHGLVRSHGGSIETINRKEGGATFLIRFPPSGEKDTQNASNESPHCR